MTAPANPSAGKPAPAGQLVDIGKLLAAYFDLKPDPSVAAQRVAFGTSGHRGCSFDRSFNEAHVLAITQAICEYRAQQNIDGPLFLGIDTHALSKPACDSALEVLAANGVEVRIAQGGEYTPTPAVSHAIIVHNRGRDSGLADGIVITPSHNPPGDGGFKYNGSNGGPADTVITNAVQERANALLEGGLKEVRRVPLQQARSAASTREHDYLGVYVADLGNVLDFELIRASGLRMGVDPLGGAGVHYWARIAERYRIDLDVVSEQVDPAFAFMSLDWDGRIRMDPSSSFAMQRLIGLKDRYDIAFACDTDHDRHGIVAPSVGLLPSNHYMAVMVDDLFQHRPGWKADAAVGKTVVSSSMIDRVAARLGRKLYETPVGFKWFADGLSDGSLGLGGEESAGASFLRRDGSAWTTDKDGMVPALFAAEITARHGQDPGERYAGLCREFGESFSSRIDAPADPRQKRLLSKLTPSQLLADTLAGEKIERVLDKAPGNGAAIGGIKVVAVNGWFAARPSGTEDIYKIYAESFLSGEHLQAILAEAQGIVDAAVGGRSEERGTRNEE
ncbi:phosphoglucomutase, alpha-D-glucose phosphate-specific [Pseudoxanthomonas yeongjuensis]|uniref:phosphoglucomutase (alpha-D-glucose-1,6-bisphosphate-dependent) n=1 Tax=Pseudoxanthomonas yeongjuensis TaxID=377616 RepID=UPI0013919292|nr:phosphoglucomutase (alpha-D-glucose-1,6-bisphosphate-dependent) [Pseudoxanthomonas yeongjuensis]KAF1717832.1 phosphoglucomutase, alpha-D-glucose phosphate-specific [Pseudoxanthomonas yeongjuensis]